MRNRYGVYSGGQETPAQTVSILADTRQHDNQRALRRPVVRPNQAQGPAPLHSDISASANRRVVPGPEVIQASGERQLSGWLNTGESRTANADRSPTYCFETHRRVYSVSSALSSDESRGPIHSTVSPTWIVPASMTIVVMPPCPRIAL